MQWSATCEPPLNNYLIQRHVRAALMAKRRTWCDEVSAAQRVLAFACPREHFLKTIKHVLYPMRHGIASSLAICMHNDVPYKTANLSTEAPNAYNLHHDCESSSSAQQRREICSAMVAPPFIFTFIHFVGTLPYILS